MTARLYQFNGVYRQFFLDGCAVFRGKFDGGSAKSYYLYAVVLYDIPKDSDIINGYELLSKDVID